MDYSEIMSHLKAKGIIFENGLGAQEINDIENFYEIRFPPDLKEFLSIALPISDNFVNWRDTSKNNVSKIKDRLNWPLEGMIFDIENNIFWYDSWGKKPNNLADAIDICKKEMRKVPKLIPIYSHRYIPSEPNEIDNPIFSVYQTDIIYYGENLLSYLQVEFDMKKYNDINFDSIKKIRFWEDLQS
ncbi:hypothetical protein [Clostridium beijerinckii]|uniref:SMI1/KNR4 family protein n=1 Tax=Clostridium beijerinckii TaxID=1520 RepID=A0A1S8S1X6_CLOBE|nr:hypothetical protein [Clostridium beijerinckii]NRY62467.1 hypothetical protein [Clostridium beijerinckii]OOM59457.1 hypothetical protein CLBCK_35000 [Clostridium beijerinckii]